MKLSKTYLLYLPWILFYSCVSDTDPYKGGNAEVVINVMTRGGYQFLVLFEDNLYYPENLPEEYKIVVQEPIPVHTRFKVLDYERDIFGPAPNDVPVFLKSIPAITLLEINQR
ncbi:hypothetical protein [Pleomorphovibrio marinus]|uniref:hypothetical protein n=1 Tax=Pleomorphovibrio marinus TaxID=2164132 RepID=UPI000E09EB57|nr:hypothetical protein [Pleomorphovibrio marinus]